MTYAQVYKAKNATIEMIERTNKSITDKELCEVLMDNGADPDGIIAITKHSNSNLGKSYYSIDMFLKMTIVPIGSVMTFNIPISGETKLISDEIEIKSSDGTGRYIKDICTSGRTS
jgi:hypothetical protein